MPSGKRTAEGGKSLAERAAEAKRRKKQKENVEEDKTTKEPEGFATVALDGDVKDLDEMGQLKALLDQALNAENDEDGILWLNGVVHECDKILRLLHDEVEGEQVSEKPTIDLETGEFDQVYGEALLQLAERLQDGQFLDVARERFEIGLERAKVINGAKLHLGLLKSTNDEEDCLKIAEKLLELEGDEQVYPELANFALERLEQVEDLDLSKDTPWFNIIKKALNKSGIAKISDKFVEGQDASRWIYAKALLSRVVNRMESEEQDDLALPLLEDALSTIKPVESLDLDVEKLELLGDLYLHKANLTSDTTSESQKEQSELYDKVTEYWKAIPREILAAMEERGERIIEFLESE